MEEDRGLAWRRWKKDTKIIKKNPWLSHRDGRKEVFERVTVLKVKAEREIEQYK